MTVRTDGGWCWGFDGLVHYFDGFAGNPQTKTKAT